MRRHSHLDRNRSRDRAEGHLSVLSPPWSPGCGNRWGVVPSRHTVQGSLCRRVHSPRWNSLAGKLSPPVVKASALWSDRWSVFARSCARVPCEPVIPTIPGVPGLRGSILQSGTKKRLRAWKLGSSWPTSRN